MAMANGEDDVSILSTPTDKTLQAAVTRPGEHNGKNDDTSIQSGMTSKSKTQQAVKLALKEVSIEHQRAMSEQQQKFQKEIEELKRALTTGEISTTLVQLQQGTAVEGTNDMETESNNEELETLPPQSSLQSLSQLISSPTRKSPVSKRPKRSKSRNSRGRGPPNSTNEVDV
jgi:2-oxoglutarate dehydrogenase complex dehydrogenase (E1) component-like enzyme